MKLVAFAAIAFVPSVVLSVTLLGGALGLGLRDAGAAAGDADLEVQSVTVEAPGSAVVSLPFSVTVNAVLRNKGPFGPVAAPIDFTLSTPPDCIRIPGGPFETVTSSLETGAAVPASVTWSVTCNGAGVRQFGGTAIALLASDVYVDPNSGNNFGDGTTSVIITSAPTPGPSAKALPSSGGQTAGDAGLPASTLVAVFAAISAAALSIALVGGYARKRRLS